jgi:hypothetical protein
VATVQESPSAPRPADPLVIAVADTLRRVEVNYDREGSGPGSRFEGMLREDVQARAVVAMVRSQYPATPLGPRMTAALLYVRDHPGCSKADAAREGSRPDSVERLIRRGLVKAEPSGPGRYALQLTERGRAACWGRQAGGTGSPGPQAERFSGFAEGQTRRVTE